MRILLVGDGPSSRAGLTSGLSRLGFKVDEVQIGLDPKTYLITSNYDAIVLDWMRFDASGAGFLADCRAAGDRIPILLLTTVDGAEERVRWFEAGVDACLVKPFDFHEMVARLRALIRRLRYEPPASPSARTWSDMNSRATEPGLKVRAIIPRTALSIMLFATLALLSASAHSEQLTLPLSPEQRQAVGEVVKEYLLQNPEVLRDASLELERRSEQLQKADQARVLAKYREQLLSSRGSTIIGNPNGKVSLVAFFDYNCPFCRNSVGDIQRLVDTNPDLRVVLREFPILGKDSTDTSRLALAVARETNDLALRGRYYASLMKAKGSMTGDLALSAAAGMGIDTTKLRHDLKDPDIDAILRENFVTAEALGVNGTPAFVIGDQVIVGAVGVDRMQAALSAVAGNSSNLRQ
ncbi:DsbA family protein [Bradyrhizobium sp. 180]|uniref:DsbA family protein n=1 Tax=unclassified Bradyrhizobium TaxID=2631580 RepID=UPI001FFBBADD|nr:MULTISPECIES: DsbA family protein [unclassified Bradyrhizobium]MCK1492138.1 DsbA family protein [Bradyrhizobium sp. 180]MCK1719492.1 DsbA family protein [Bradyrhizobium sp. 141]